MKNQTRERIPEFFVLFFLLLIFGNAENRPGYPSPRLIRKTIDSLTIEKPVRTGSVFHPVKKTDFVYQLKNLSEAELRSKMESEGFVGLDRYQKNHLRQIYAAFKYQWLFTEVSKRSGLQVPVIWAVFGFESLDQGVETALFRIHLNPGGMKLRSGAQAVKYYDDCGPVPCSFSKWSEIDQMVDNWSDCLSKYANCSGSIEDTLKCMQESGYHTADAWRARSRLARKFELYKKTFPASNTQI